MRRFSCATILNAKAVFFSTTVARLSSSENIMRSESSMGRAVASSSSQTPSSTPLAAPPILSESQVESYNRDGYVIVEDVIPSDQLDYLGTVVREAAKARGLRFVPQSDKQHRPNAVQFEATLHEAMPADQRHKLGPNGQHEATFERREKRIKITCRNRKEMERAYKKIVAMRQQYAQYKGVELAPKAPGNLSKADSSENYLKSKDSAAAKAYEAKQKEMAAEQQRMAEAQQQQQQFAKMRSQSRAETNAHGFSENADDDVDVHSFQKEQARKSFDEYRNSGKMEADVRKGSHLDEAFAHIYNGGQTWMQVAQKYPKLRDAVFSRRLEDAFAANYSVAARLGAIGAQLAGCMTTRLYTDTIIQRTPFCNALPFHHDSSGLNFRDPRGLQAAVVLGGSAQPFDEHHGGYVVLPGSHKVIQQITNDCRDQTGFVRPAAWELGEALRSYPQLLVIKPRMLGEIKPGSVLFMCNTLVYSNAPNIALKASEKGRARLFSNEYKQALLAQSKPPMEMDSASDAAPPAPRAEMFMDEAPLLYTLSIMPDGNSFDGVRNTWMSKDSNGPLFKFEAGQPLRDPAVFPVLYSEIPDTL